MKLNELIPILTNACFKEKDNIESLELVSCKEEAIFECDAREINTDSARLTRAQGTIHRLESYSVLIDISIQESTAIITVRPYGKGADKISTIITVDCPSCNRAVKISDMEPAYYAYADDMVLCCPHCGRFFGA